MIIPKCIAFDFDGVLCDSLDETMVVSYYAYGTLHELNRIHPYSCDHVPQELAKIFFHFRPLVRVAEEYYLLWALILERADLKETEPLCEQAQHIPFPKQQFRELFFQERKNWRANNEASWKRHLSLYPEMKLTLKILKDRETPTFIVSSKDEAAIRQILFFFFLQKERTLIFYFFFLCFFSGEEKIFLWEKKTPPPQKKKKRKEKILPYR